MTDKQNFEKDINVPSKRLDYTDKIHTELANYEQMERDIEKIIQPYLFEGEKEYLTLTQAVEILLIRHNDALGHCMKRLKEKNEKLEKIKDIAKFYKKEGRYTTGVVMDKILKICDEVHDGK